MTEPALLIVGIAAVILLMLAAARLGEARRHGAAPAGPKMQVHPTDRDALAALLAEQLSPEAAHTVESLILPSIRVLSEPVAEAAPEPGASRIGGAPDLPPGHPWPDREGRPLSFLAQISCAELPDLDGASPLPREGMLWFFYDNEEQPWGFDPAHRGGWKVIYHPGDPGRATPTSSPQSVADEGRFEPCRAWFRPEFTLPPEDCSEIEAADLVPVDADRLVDILSDLETTGNRPLTRMLGHPNPIQSGRMQLECQLVSHGINCGDPTGYQGPRAAELARTAGEWTLLLQLDSQNDMMWGDVGRLYFYIRQEDLRQRRFDDVWTILECI